MMRRVLFLLSFMLLSTFSFAQDTIYVEEADTVFVQEETVYIDTTITIVHPVYLETGKHWILQASYEGSRPFFAFYNNTATDGYVDSVRHSLSHYWRNSVGLRIAYMYRKFNFRAGADYSFTQAKFEQVQNDGQSCDCYVNLQELQFAFELGYRVLTRKKFYIQPNVQVVYSSLLKISGPTFREEYYNLRNRWADQVEFRSGLFRVGTSIDFWYRLDSKYLLGVSPVFMADIGSLLKNDDPYTFSRKDLGFRFSFAYILKSTY